MARKLKVPERQKEPLAQLVAFEEEQIESLKTALAESEPAQIPPALAGRVAARIKDIPAEVAGALVGMLCEIAFTSFAIDNSLAEMADEVSVAAGVEGLVSGTGPGSSAARLNERLRTLLATSSISLTSKAMWLSTRYDRTFVRCAVYSDIRTIFAPNDTELQPQAGMVVHSLEIEVHKGSEHKSEYVAMRGDDLRSLRDALDRAIAKEEMLQKIIAKDGLYCIPIQ